MEELLLFNLPHFHDYEIWKGPVQMQPPITLPSGTKWCWTCDEWVDAKDGLTYSQREGIRV